jgi:hypothetical protein
MSRYGTTIAAEFISRVTAALQVAQGWTDGIWLFPPGHPSAEEQPARKGTATTPLPATQYCARCGHPSGWELKVRTRLMFASIAGALVVGWVLGARARTAPAG